MSLASRSCPCCSSSLSNTVHMQTSRRRRRACERTGQWKSTKHCAASGARIRTHCALRAVWQFASGDHPCDTFTAGTAKDIFATIAVAALKADCSRLQQRNTTILLSPVECSVSVRTLSWTSKKPQLFKPDPQAAQYLDENRPKGAEKENLSKYFGNRGKVKTMASLSEFVEDDTAFLNATCHFLVCAILFELDNYCTGISPDLPRPVTLGPSLLEGSCGKLKREVAEQGSMRVRDACLRAKLCARKASVVLGRELT